MTPAGAAALPGVEPGDRVVAVDGRLVAGWAGLAPAVEEGKTYRLEIRRYDGALEAVDRALEIEPGNVTARMRRAEVLLEYGVRGDASEKIDEAREIVI